MIILMLMAVMSTGSAEIIAVASIIIYDIYQMYIEPFRKNHPEGCCIICQLKHNDCRCVNVNKCKGCKEDNNKRSGSKGLVRPHFTCPMHKGYKEYQEKLLGFKNWCIVVCTFLTVPLVLFGYAISLNLAWTYYFMGVLISSSVIPITLAMIWPRASSQGMICGVVLGCICGISSWLIFASSYEGGLSSQVFITNSGKVAKHCQF